MMRGLLSRARLEVNRAVPSYSYANLCQFTLILAFKGLQTLRIIENKEEEVKTECLSSSNVFNVMALQSKRYCEYLSPLPVKEVLFALS